MIAVMYICVFWTNNTGRLASISASHWANFTQFAHSAALSEHRLALGVSRVTVFLCADDCRGSPEGKVLLSSDRPYLTGGVSVARSVYQAHFYPGVTCILSFHAAGIYWSCSAWVPSLYGTMKGPCPWIGGKTCSPRKVFWQHWGDQSCERKIKWGKRCLWCCIFKMITLKWRLEFRCLGGCVCAWPVNACICAWWGCFSI